MADEQTMKIDLVNAGESLTFMAKGKTGHWLAMDAPESLGGHNSASRPMEVILQGLAGCTGMDVMSILKKKRVKIDHFAMTVEAERADIHPKVFTKIHLTYKFWGKDLSEKAIDRAIDLSENKYCSVSEMLRSTAKITSSYEMNPET